MTDNWKQNKNWISWTIRRRGQYEREEHISNLKFFQSSSIIWNLQILCCCRFYAWWYSEFERSVPFNGFHAPKRPIRNKTNPIPSRDTWGTLNRAFGRDRVGIELIQDIVFWKDHQAVIPKNFFFKYWTNRDYIGYLFVVRKYFGFTIYELMIIYVLY